MARSSYVLRAGIPAQVTLDRRTLDREVFFSWVWEVFAAKGLLGIHEGTLLSEEAYELGFEGTSSTLDTAQAPRGRDWVSAQNIIEAEFYFAHPSDAQAASVWFAHHGLEVFEIREQPDQDWDSDWKASFTGISIAPYWQILPPWVDVPANESGQILRINPGAGFGTGTHETTQLCLKVLAEQCARGRSIQRVLDFGSGSGILSIAAVLSGATQVDAVEIDSMAHDNARENAQLNSLGAEAIRFLEAIPESSSGGYDLVFANILRPVLLEFAERLVRCLAPQGLLILSGLIETDVGEIEAKYTPLVGRAPLSIRALGDWRALEY
jgi:ribosomal protein L11 methyltransferase